MSTLYIYNSRSDKQLLNLTDVYIYNINSGNINNVNSQNINDSKRLHEIALEQRDTYSEYIYSLNSKYLENELIYDERLSLYFISDLSGKRTALFKTYISICHIILIQEKLKNKKINRVIIDGCTLKFIQSIKSIFSTHEVEVLNSLKENLFIFNYLLKQLLFYIKTLCKWFIIKINMVGKIDKRSINNLYLTRFPMHFDSQFREEKYGDLLNEDDFYLISVITDGLHQNQSLVQFIYNLKQLKFIKSPYILLDAYLSFKDIIYSYFNSIKFLRYQLKFNSYKFYYNKINITQYINHEINQSFIRIPRLDLYKNSIIEIFKSSKVNNFIYYLHEFSYGRFFTYILSNYFPTVNKIGFQHGAPSRRTLLCYLAESEPAYSNNDYFKFLPMPNEIYTENEFFKSIYEEAGYKNVSIMKNIPRLKYLSNIKRINIVNNTILIACGMHDYRYFIDHCLDEIYSNLNFNYIFKFHPKTNYDSFADKINRYKFKNLKVGDKHISVYLSYVSEVIVSYSSVGYEAYCLGIPVKVKCLPNRINESPLLDLFKSNSSLITIDYN